MRKLEKITKGQRILCLLTILYVLALLIVYAAESWSHPRRAQVQTRSVEVWEDRMEQLSPEETEEFLRQRAQERGTYVLEDGAYDPYD